MPWKRDQGYSQGFLFSRRGSIGITLDLYSYVLPGMQAEAAEQVDAALQAAISATQKMK